MLLLVLILVLVAFALLVVALLTGSVLSAWLSVGVSVVAAVVLVIDWLQRRSAVKAGAEPAAEVPRATSAEPEPVTEVLPVVPPAGAPPAVDEPTTAAPFESSGFESGRDVQRTVAISPVQPSGSGSRPSGADQGVTSSSGSSSQSVTKNFFDRTSDSTSVSDAPAGGSTSSGAGRTVSAEARSAADDAHRVDMAKKPDTARPDPDATVVSRGAAASTSAPRSDDAAVVSGVPAGSPRADDATVVSGGGAAAAGSPRAGDTTVVSAAAAAGSPRAGDATVVSAAAAADSPRADDATVVSRGDGARSGPGDATVVSRAGGTDAGDETVVSRDTAASAVAGRPDVERPAGAGGRESGPDTTEPDGGGFPHDAPLAGGAPAAASDATAATFAYREPAASGAPSGAGESRGGWGGAVDTGTAGPRADDPSRDTARDDQSSGGLFDPVVSGSPPPDEPVGVDTAGEPPEEASDADAVRIVAALEDEVVVVDEQPRYHLGACRALAAVEVIPLPVREAVELGFTPCGWCTPDATLAGRHRADARP